MSNSQKENQNQTYWTTLKEYHNDPSTAEVKANEFMKGVTDEFDISEMPKVSRRKFLALLSASAAFAAAGCSDYFEKGEIVPYNNRPEEVIPGIANYYASTCSGCEQACGILVKTREGRPIKVDGNPDHPINQGKVCNIAQASVLNLYDPSRLKKPQKRLGGRFIETSWNSVDKDVVAGLQKAVSENKEIALIIEPVRSPAFQKLINDFSKVYPTAKIYSYNFSTGGAAKNALENPRNISFDKAKVIVSFDSDFLYGEGNFIENARAFVKGRNAGDLNNFNRLYVIEGGMSLTGMNSDYRIRLRPDAQLQFINLIQNSMNGNSAGLQQFASAHKIDIKVIEQLLKDIQQYRNKTAFVAGNHLPEEVHIAVNQMNQNSNEVFSDIDNIEYFRNSSIEDLNELTGKMKNNSVGAVIIMDSNPVYHLPQDFDFSNSLKNVPLTVTLSEYENETSVNSNYVLPINHMLESWGDYNARKGIYSLQQPVIAPLYDTRQKEAVLLNWLNENPGAYKENIYHEYLMNSWNESGFTTGTSLTPQKFWYSALEAGVVQTEQKQVNAIQNQQQSQVNYNRNITPTNDYVVQLRESYSVGNGKFANNGMLQELPHPVTKIVWDNYASVSPDTAKDLDVDSNDLVEITIENRKQKFPVFVQPGMADKVILIETGYGRTNAGAVANNVGVNANVLMSKNFQLSPVLYNNAKITKVDGKYELVSTSEHHRLDDEFLLDVHKKRHIIREGNLQNYNPDDPNYLNAGDRVHKSLHKLAEFTKEGVKWGMGIDLNKCIGCSVCVTSCNVENNIPVVGKDQVDRGREMHWLRIDRYYSGTPNNPEVATQPMLCQHCDTAPCENVCPVVATTHSEDGLNQMAYNRCVGTRYCSNNCPYKVRRFNFYDFRDNFEDGYYNQQPFNLVNNPEVTVRSRGVMEKCTFCIQRIMQAREDAIEQGRPLRGSDVVTACQSACPTDAIVFGDTNDPNSSVSKYREHNLAYHVLDEINTRPNVTYLAKLRNTNSEGNGEH